MRQKHKYNKYLHLFLALSSMSMLKWWWRFHARSILPSCGAPRSTRAAPAGPTPSRGSSVLNALQLCHTLITQEAYLITRSLAQNAVASDGDVIGANPRRTCLCTSVHALNDALAGKQRSTPRGDSPWPVPVTCALGHHQHYHTKTIARTTVHPTTRPTDKIYFGLWKWMNATESTINATGGSKTDDTIFLLRSDPYKLESNSRAANKIITNVHEMLVKLFARGLRHRIEIAY